MNGDKNFFACIAQFVFKIVIGVLILNVQTSVCSAKLIYDNSGRITFETSNDWYYVSMGEDFATLELHSIALDKDTAVTFKQSKFTMPYKSMRTMPASEKSVIRDRLIQYNLNLFKAAGYSTVLNKADIFDDAIIMGFTLKKNGSVYKAVTMYGMKDYVVYSIALLATDNTAYEAMTVAKTLKIDGIPFNVWIQQ